MRRRVVRIAVAVSLVLCLAVHVSWLRSHWYSETVDWSGRGGWRSVRTAAGQVEISLLLVDWSKTPAAQLHGPSYERGPAQRPFNQLLEQCHSVGDQRTHWEGGGFAWHSILNFKLGQHDAVVVVPFWFLATASAFLPMVVASLRMWRGGRQGSGVGGRGITG